jgi:formate hydrogenlyase subunit 3/multisubunit Na+/H+ antiporter MnhD subunit
MIWILIPGLVGIVLYFLRRWRKLTVISATVITGLLALAAAKIPIGEIILIGPWSFKISNTLQLLGRRFILDNPDRPLLVLISLTVTFWLAGSYLARPGSLFIPSGLGIMALLTAALAVEPFFYAAMLIEMAALLCVPLLSALGQKNNRGVLRFITFQTIGIPFILFTGWLLSEYEINPANSDLLAQAAILSALGFGFLMAIFPFHTWIPMLSEEAHPYAAAFVFFMLPGFVSLFGLGFLERYAWLRNAPNIFSLLRSVGLLMIVTGGIFAAFQNHLGRMMGYAVIVDLGISFLALGLSQGATPEGLNQPVIDIFYALFVSRGLALGLWSLALSVISKKLPNLSFHSAKGLGRKMPVVSGSLVLAQLSLAGFPLLAGFPQRLALWERLAQISAINSLWALIGCAALIVGAMRVLAMLVTGDMEELQNASEEPELSVVLGVAIFALFYVGLSPL